MAIRISWVMAARQAPQVRIFRNDFGSVHAVAVRLQGTKSNRDAIGARVTVETDRLRKTRIRPGRFRVPVAVFEGTADRPWPSERIVKLTVDWPSGGTQVITDVRSTPA
jgi:hypothetical protein